MLSKKKLRKKKRLIDYILIFGFAWMALNVVIAMYVKIETDQMQEIMSLSVLFSMIVILSAALVKFLLYLTNKFQSKLENQLSKRDPRNRR